jgi:hypothetical protein
MAIAADACLGTGAWDESRWRTERRRFETFVVDD